MHFITSFSSCGDKTLKSSSHHRHETFLLNESYWAVLSCGVDYYALDKMVLPFESVDEIL